MATTSSEHGFLDADPQHQITWVDPETGATGYLVVHTLVGGIATGGTRMRPGCTLAEVGDLARGMATKTAAFNLPVGGAKGGIDFDPRDPRAVGVLTRYVTAMRDWVDRRWVTAEDLGVTQARIDAVFANLGLGQSYHAAISRGTDPDATLARVRAGMDVRTHDDLELGEVIGGYGVACAARAAIAGLGWDHSSTRVAVQGVGTMGGAAALYLHEAGVRVTTVADAAGTLHDPRGLDVPALLAARDVFGEIDRSQVPATVTQLPREAVIGADVDVLIPAAVSYAITGANVAYVQARLVVEAANCATTAEAEEALTGSGVVVVPDFVANAGAAAWAWWLLQGQVGLDPDESFTRMEEEMTEKVTVLARAWTQAGTPMRLRAREMAVTNHDALAGTDIAIP